MKIFEFARSEDRGLASVRKHLVSKFGEFDRIGGASRVFEIEGTGQLAALYLNQDGILAVGLAWEKDQHQNLGITTVFVWPKYDPNEPAPYAIDIPLDLSFEQYKDKLVEMIRQPQLGEIMISGNNKKITEMARRSTESEFVQMCVAMYGTEKARALTMPEMMACAAKNDVQIPGSVRSNVKLKVDAHHWNLSGGENAPDSADTSFAKSQGPIEPAPEMDPDVAALKTVQGVARMTAQGKVYLFGRKPNGAFFKIPGIEHIIPQLERLLARALPGSNEHTMDEQYEMLADRVNLVAGGEASFIKSLLITGAPSSGKTFTVLKTIKALGLQEGRDYTIKKGRITTLAMYRTLIEQVNGMVIFDDCDSVVEDKNAVNMLKGALDTDPIREISYDVQGTVNTAVMSAEDRDEYVNVMSRVLRGEPEDGDLDRFVRKVVKPKKEPKDYDGIWDPYQHDMSDDELLEEVQNYMVNHLPNKIDFKGRIIFISNMAEEEWDSAIITRAFYMNMDFRSDEMIDYIDKIKQHIKTPSLSEEEKQEVMDYIRELYVTGKLKRAVNFRLVQQAFDLRLTANWKKMIAML